MNPDPIIIVDDDDEDLELIQQAFAELKIENEIIIFNDGLKFLSYVNDITSKIFFILCDINMSPVNGLQLKERIWEDGRLRLKCIPFVFLSTSSTSASVMRAYSFGVQGYFVKPNTFPEIKKMLLSIMNYWSDSQHPASAHYKTDPPLTESKTGLL